MDEPYDPLARLRPRRIGEAQRPSGLLALVPDGWRIYGLWGIGSDRVGDDGYKVTLITDGGTVIGGQGPTPEHAVREAATLIATRTKEPPK